MEGAAAESLAKTEPNCKDEKHGGNTGRHLERDDIKSDPEHRQSQDTELEDIQGNDKRTICNENSQKVEDDIQFCPHDADLADGTLLSGEHGDESSSRPYIPDGGYGWVITASACYLSLVGVGTIMCYGVMYVEFLDFFNEGRTKTSIVGSMCTFACAFGGPISGSLAVRFGHRPVVIVGSIIATVGMVMSAFAVNIYFLYVTFGLLTGLGTGMTLIPSLAMVAMYFDKRLSLASGLAMCGGGLSYIVFPTVSEACIKHYTWRGTMYILAAFWIQGCICGALMRPLAPVKRTKIQDGGTKQDGDRKTQIKKRSSMCDSDLIRTWQFWFYLLEEYLWHIDFMNFVVILPDFVVLSGYTKEQAALLLTIIGIFVIPSRLLGGYVVDRAKVSPILLLAGGIVVLGTSSIIMPFTKHSFEGLAVMCAIRGSLHGVLVVLLPQGLVILFSREKLTIMIGCSSFFVLFGSLSAPPLGGLIYDTTGDYMYAYITCCLISYVTSVIPLVLFLDNRKKTKSKCERIDEVEEAETQVTLTSEAERESTTSTGEKKV